MELIVDGRWGGKTGIGRVWGEILKRKPDDINITYIEKKFSAGDPLSPWFLYQEIKKNEFNAFYSPSFMPPLPTKVPSILTVHDLTHLYYYSYFHKFYFKYIIRSLLTSVKTIITDSSFSRDRLISELNVSPDKIKVIFLGVEEKYMLNTESFKADRPYFLYIGNRRSYKNIDRMLTAFSNANIPNDFVMYLSGKKDDQINKTITQLGIIDRVEFLGDIEESELPKIYKGAFALLYVSLMEGFGLPVIESMASGTPVITSDLTCLPEIAGGAALLVDPLNVKEISAMIEKLVLDKELYIQMKELGFKRALNFNWDVSAKETWFNIKNVVR